jgi:hypothetical protein
MKNVLWHVPLILLMALSGPAFASSPEGAARPEAGSSYAVSAQEFGMDLDFNYCYSYLAPYGNWVNLDPWGYVWCPRHMGYRWRPYSRGHWIWTDYGWTWISDFDWGWIPFHYGRWGWDDDLGWFWVPGTVWGPAWVTWRSSDLYCGWAPFPPGIEFRAGMDFASFGINIPFRFWIFIGASHFCDRDIYPYVLPYERNMTIINYTTIHNNFAFRGNRFVNEGIGIDMIRRLTRRDVPRYTLRDTRQPGPPRIAGNEVHIYRPTFRGSPSARPQRFLSREQARQELAPARIYESREQPPKRTAESAVRQRQNEERKLMKKSQSQDMKAMERRRSEEQKQVQASSERARIQQDYRTKKSDMGKQHQSEKQRMNERHRTDTEQARRTDQARKQAPPQRKKK